MNTADKNRLHEHVVAILDQRIEECQKAMAAFQDAANNETKSTAGDKHETSRAMMQADRDKVAVQLGNLLKMKPLLKRLGGASGGESIALGSLVTTDKGVFYLAIPLGNVEFESTDVIVISAVSPIAKAMIGKSEGDAFELNGVKREVLSLI